MGSDEIAPQPAPPLEDELESPAGGCEASSWASLLLGTSEGDS